MVPFFIEKLKEMYLFFKIVIVEFFQGFLMFLFLTFFTRYGHAFSN